MNLNDAALYAGLYARYIQSVGVRKNASGKYSLALYPVLLGLWPYIPVFMLNTKHTFITFKLGPSSPLVAHSNFFPVPCLGKQLKT